MGICTIFGARTFAFGCGFVVVIFVELVDVVESVSVVSVCTKGVEVAIISAVDVAMRGVLVAKGVVDVAVSTVVSELLLLVEPVGRAKLERRELHVFPMLAGIAYAVAHTRLAALLAVGSILPSVCWSDAR